MDHIVTAKQLKDFLEDSNYDLSQVRVVVEDSNGRESALLAKKNFALRLANRKYEINGEESNIELVIKHSGVIA